MSSNKSTSKPCGIGSNKDESGSVGSLQQQNLTALTLDTTELANNIKAWGKSLGFQQVGISDIDMSQHKSMLQTYLANGYHGAMDYLSRNVEKRLAPDKLHANTCRIISVRMNYLPPEAKFANNLKNDNKAYISRYALGRDYHKLMRNRLKQLGEKIKQHCAQVDFRPFVDSAPVLEHAVAEKAGLGWTGKHTLTINQNAGSWFFLGELFVNIPLPLDKPVAEQCGTCKACISICPTQAIIAPYTLDARRCISYLTIEHKGIIPEIFRTAMGNRIYGCDDCQLVCPWNRYADVTDEKDFYAREFLKGASLISLFELSEQAFLEKTQGSPIRRIGHESWQRNLSIAMGNARFASDILLSLQNALITTNNKVLIAHFEWAINEQKRKSVAAEVAVSTRQHQRLIRIIEKGLPRDA